MAFKFGDIDMTKFYDVCRAYRFSMLMHYKTIKMRHDILV